MNRIDEIVRFRSLTEADLVPIVDIQLRHVADRLAAKRITLELTPAAKAWLADRGYDPAYGARPLRRLVAKAVGDELARRLLAGELADGDMVQVDADGDRLTFARRQPAAVS